MKDKISKAFAAANAVVEVLDNDERVHECWDRLDALDVGELTCKFADAIVEHITPDFYAYQAKAHETSGDISIGGDLVLYPALGLGNEAGEFLGKIKKIYRDKDGNYSDAEREALKGELGDVLWYLAEICTQLGLSLAEVAHANNVKTHDRKARGVIGGSGDNR